MVYRSSCASFAPPDYSCILDQRGTILSVHRDLADATIGGPVSLEELHAGRSFLDFCSGPESGVVREELENLLSGRKRCFSTVANCGGSTVEGVPIAFIGTAIKLGHEPRFNVRRISMNFGTAFSPSNGVEQQRCALQLNEFFSNPSLDRWALIKDQPALRAVTHLLASLENIRTSMDEAIYCHDHGASYRRLSHLLMETAGVVDSLIERVSPPTTSRN